MNAVRSVRLQLLTALAAALCAAPPGTAAAAAPVPGRVLSDTASAGCDSTCLSSFMNRYLDHATGGAAADVPLAATAVVRENAAPVSAAAGLWNNSGRPGSRHVFADPVSGNVYGEVTLRHPAGQTRQVATRLRVQAGHITEMETLGGETTPSTWLPAVSIPVASRASREELIEIANGYFEALGMRDPGAVRLTPDCQRFEAGQQTPCAAGLAQGTGQQVIERRFPVALPENGVVVGYGFLMHHDRVPPQDEFIEAVFRIEAGRIRQIRSRRLAVPAPGRSGFAGDSPEPGILREVPFTLRPVVLPPLPPSPPEHHYPGYYKLHSLLRYGRLHPPPLPVLNPPYPGIHDARDVPYGPDPEQRMDILAPTAKAAPRTVLVFVHGGAWTGGSKRLAGDVLYENVVVWAARHGMVAVNMDYRLADYVGLHNLFPTQEQDLAAAVDWIGSHIGTYGGDPNRIFLWGHSAGGSTIAGYVSNPALYGRSPGVRGVFLMSSPLEPVIEERSHDPIRYYGTAHQDFVDRAPLETLIHSDIPVLYGYSPTEEMVPELEDARRRLCAAGHCPQLVLTQGSHSEEVRAVGTADSRSTDALLRFMAGIH